MKTRVKVSIGSFIILFFVSFMSFGQGTHLIGIVKEFQGGDYIYRVDKNGNNFQKTFHFYQATSGLSNPIKVNNEYWGTSRGGDFQRDVIYAYQPGDQYSRKIVSFNDSTSWLTQYGSRLIKINGGVWGTTRNGGQNGNGAIFSIDTLSEQLTIEHHFGQFFFGPVGNIVSVNNKIYGLTDLGGVYGDGMLYEYDISSGTISVLVNLRNDSLGSVPWTGIHLINSKLWFAMTYGGINNMGTLSYYDIQSGNSAIVHHFDGSDGTFPKGEITSDLNNIYGTCNEGGQYDYGSIFKYNLNTDSMTIIHHFDSSNTNKPRFNIALQNEKIFGTSFGDWGDTSFIYSIDTNGNNFQNLYPFFSTNTGFDQIDDKIFVNLIPNSNTSSSSMVSVDNNFHLDTIHEFYNYYGINNDYGMIQYGNELFFATKNGGTGNSGCLCKTDLSGLNIEVLFCNYDSIYANLSDNIGANEGFIYGSTHRNGVNNKGLIFRKKNNSQGVELLFELDSATSGYFLSPPVFYNDKVIFTSAYGGQFGFGSIFQLDTNGLNFNVLHSFNSFSGGFASELILESNSLFGIQGSDKLFEFNLSNNQYFERYTYNNQYGIYPALFSFGNKIYGLSTNGGLNNSSFAYSINTDGTSFNIGHNFADIPNYGFRSIGSYYDGNIWFIALDANTFNRPSLIRYNPFNNSTNFGYSFWSSNSLSFSRVIVPDGSVSLLKDDSIIQENLLIFPNPVEDVMNFKLKKGEFGKNIQILDLTGKIVSNQKLSTLNFNIANLERGFYMGKLETNKETYSFKFIKN